MRTDLERRILDALADSGKPESELAAEIGVDEATFRECWERLHREMLVIPAMMEVAGRPGKERRIMLTPRGRQLLRDG